MSNDGTGVEDYTFVVLWCRIYPPIDSWASDFYFCVKEEMIRWQLYLQKINTRFNIWKEEKDNTKKRVFAINGYLLAVNIDDVRFILDGVHECMKMIRRYRQLHLYLYALSRLCHESFVFVIVCQIVLFFFKKNNNSLLPPFSFFFLKSFSCKHV
mgnify:CR=1 FL=1